LLKLKGYDSLGEVEQFKGAHLFLPQRELPKIGEEEFYAYELVGMEVWTDKGRNLGRVKRKIYSPFEKALKEDQSQNLCPYIEISR